MASLLSSEAKRMYSWWWDSHNTPKNSKWLHENLSDMDDKVKTMIKLIEEDADSFARKAEMYYKKRPELMKLVEEFYRAYRALAERYDHATGELRHAHRTMAKALPDKIPFELVEDSSSGSSAQEKGPHMLELNRTVRALLDADELVQNTLGHSSVDIHTAKTTDLSNLNMEGHLRWYGLKELPKMFGAKETVAEISKSSDRKGANQENDREESLDDEVLLLSTENMNLKYTILHENERAGKAESEVQRLRKALVVMEGEKEETLLQYQQCLQKLSKLEEQLNNAQKDSMGFSERAGLAENEILTLKEALIQLEAEKNAGLVKQKEYLEKIFHLDAMASQLQKDMKGAGSQARTLEDKASRLELEKEEVVRQYNQCLSKLSYLENTISVMEDKAGVLKNQAERAEAEVSELKNALADANEEKDASAKQYNHCLEIISKLEKELTDANDNVQCLNNEVLVGNAKLKTAEGKCNMLELSNQTLQVEADNLAKYIAVKDQELLKKQEELEKLQICLQDENVRHTQVEATLQALQDLYSQSQDDQRGLALEFKNVRQMLKDMEESKTVLEEEIQQVRDENHQLNQANLSSAVSMEGMQSQILSLREIKERLDKEVTHHVGISISLKKEIFCLKEEIDDISRSYQAIIEQVEAAGLNPKCVVASVKNLQDENSRLREMCEQDSNEKAILSKKLENMEDVLKKAVVVESSLSDLNAELESSCKKVSTLQETCQNLHGEKASLVDEKASLLSQLQVTTENMHNLLEKNAILENSLCIARVELECLREKSKRLEEICELLKDERSYLLTERDTLVSKLENAEGKLERMEKRYMGLEEKYASLQKEKESMHCQVDKLEIFLGIEKQERMSSQVLSESRLAGLENQIYLLQEENRWKKKESEEELDKALKAQFELSIIQKFMKDIEEKNCSLIIECQKHVEASKLAERVISKLESESLGQQVESEVLLDEIERLRLSIYQIFRTLETVPDYAPVDKIENEQAFVHHILESIEDMKCLMSEHEDDKQQLFIENTVLLALLEQLKSNSMDIVSQKLNLEQEFKIMANEFAIVRNDKEKLQDLNRQLKSDASTGRQHVAILKAELASLCSKQADLQKKYEALMADYSQVNGENTCLLKKFSELEGEKCQVIQLNDTALQEIFETATQSEVLRGFGAEKVAELKLLLGDLIRQRQVNSSLENELNLLREKLKLQNAEGLVLQDAVHGLEEELREMTEFNVQMDQDIKNGKEKLIQTEAELLDTEMKLVAVEKLNSSFSMTVAKLKRDARQSIEIRENLQDNIAKLSEDNSSQKKDVESLLRAKENLESELRLLHQEIEENTLRELSLHTELQELNNEFEVWEAEASTFCFDLQVSSVQEVLLKNKVEELTGVCKTVENECAAKTLELEEMKGKVCSSENKISGLKSQLNTYGPVIASLRDDVMLLERNLLLQADFKAAQGQEPEFSGIAAYANEDSFQMPPHDQCLLSLKDLQIRVKAVRELMEGTKRPHLQTHLISCSKEEPAVCVADQLKPHRSFARHKHERSRRKGQSNGLYNYPKLQRMKSKVSKGRSGMLMKDIPLDQVSDNPRQGMSRRGCVEESNDQILELWQTAESGNKMECDPFENFNAAGLDPPSTDSDMERELDTDYNKLYLPTLKAKSNREVGDEKILNRLASDAQRLDLLQTVVDNLRTTWESSRKSKKAKKSDSQAIHEQLLEAEDTLVQLIDLNSQLVNHIELCPHDETASPRLKETVNTWRMKVLEQAEKGSERISRLHFELQRVQYNLMKLGDDYGRKLLKGKNQFFRSRSIILRDFVYMGRKNSRRRKKDPNCGWFRQSNQGKINNL